MLKQFLPVFAVNRLNLLKKLQRIEGDFGVLATFVESDNFLTLLRSQGKPYFIDSGVFEDKGKPWYCQIECTFVNDRWVRELKLADRQQLQHKLKTFFDRCDRFSPDYVFAPDVFGEPLISLHLAQIAWEEYSSKPRPYCLIGVVQMGEALYNWQNPSSPQVSTVLPHYHLPKSFLTALISEYRNIGFQRIALGGLLKPESTMPMGLKFGLSSQELDDLLTWSRPDFVLGGLALTRLEVLRKHQVWADSTNWLWWDARYDRQRFGDRDALQEIFTPLNSANFRNNSYELT
ncbi:hypothetical protein [Leptolyngbya sp. GGD]|uniref:hypothetical protein n=1 Tax=Leptolyngbya sp. GGD TaxID=2997907 RepID=UPI00227B1536|nr:hypothetical protein [Leptolyngbya sp. GGD]MCY6493410.1 hypothetical protein [Leptolyngbya sp. GGD]